MPNIDRERLLNRMNDIRNQHLDDDEGNITANDAVVDWFEIVIDEIESGTFDDHSAQEETPDWEEIAGIQEAKAVQAEQETARLRDKLKQIDGQRMQTEQERCYFKKKAETYIEDIAWLEGKVSELEARAIQAEHERDEWKLICEEKQRKADKNHLYAVQCEAEIDALLEGLKWYADNEKWEKHYGNIAAVDFDKGELARTIISKLEGSKPDN